MKTMKNGRSGMEKAQRKNKKNRECNAETKGSKKEINGFFDIP